MSYKPLKVVEKKQKMDFLFVVEHIRAPIP